MKLRVRICILGIAMLPCAAGQGITYQQREEMSYQRRVAALEEDLAARSENIKDLTEDIAGLKSELKNVREQARSAANLSKSNQDRIDQISGIGRLILGAVAFLIGAIVTQFVSKFMPAHGPRIAREHKETAHARRAGAA